MTTAGAGRRHEVGRADEFPLGVCTRIEVAGRAVVIVRTPAGFYAVQDRCPHMGAPLSRGDVRGTVHAPAPDELVYDDDEPVIRCPWHRWEFDLSTGAAVGGVTNARARVFDVAVDEGVVYLITRG